MNKLNELLGFLLETVKQTKEFAGAQMPLLCQEIVKYYTLSNLLWSVFWCIITLSCCYLAKRGWVESKKNDGFMPIFFLGAILSLVTIVLTLTYVDNVLKGIYAPRVVLIEQLKGMLSSK